MGFRILDSRGRLFGKINLIDLAVMIGILLVGIGVYKLLFEKQKVPPVVQVTEERRNVIVTIEIPNKPIWFSRVITVGDMETNEQNQPLGIILEKKTSRVRSLTLGPDGKALFLYDPSREDIVLKVELKASVNKGELLFKNAKLRVGKGISLETRRIWLEGLITDVQLN